MRLSTPELLLNAQAFLGEGPAWDSAHQRLYWVDIYAGHLHFFDPKTGLDEITNLGQALGCAAPTSSGGVIMGLKDGLATLQLPTSSLTFLSRPEKHLPGNRFNDGKCSPDGRFLAGTMDSDEVAASGSLYSLSPDGSLKTLLTGTRISNGLAWSPDYKTFYFIDTPTRQVVAYDYDILNGDIANPRIVVTVPVQLGWPDGMTSDLNGNLWVALWGGAALSVWNPVNGALIEKINLPAKNVTACVFGGAEQNELYVTSARKGLTPADIQAFPATGGLFRIRTNVTGLPTFVYDDLPLE